MTFILRWPSILVLFAMSALSFIGAAAGGATLLDKPLPTPGVEEQTMALVAQTTWLEVGLWAGAGLFFLISAIRLIRRTQGFWTWLLGFACYGGRWAFSQQDGSVLETVRAIDPNVYLEPQALLADLGAPATQVGLLAVVLLVGLVILVLDAADRAYWDKQGA
jgi:hypothetical protein